MDIIVSRGHLWPVAVGGRIHSSPKISLSTPSTAFDFDIYIQQLNSRLVLLLICLNQLLAIRQYLLIDILQWWTMEKYHPRKYLVIFLRMHILKLYRTYSPQIRN